MARRLRELLARHADAAIAAVVFLLVTLAAAFLPTWNALERRVFDILTVTSAKGELTQPIVLVAINEEAFNALKLRWPWPRSLHAELVKRMAEGGAAVIALDMLLAEPSEPAEDAALAEAIRKAGNVVMARHRALRSGSVPAALPHRARRLLAPGREGAAGEGSLACGAGVARGRRAHPLPRHRRGFRSDSLPPGARGDRGRA